MFRDDFVWGVATSAHQIEGEAPELESGENVWDMFTAAGKCHEGQTAKVTCDHAHHYREDFQMMKQLGIKAYRFSLNWARILPEGIGKVSEKGVAFYRNLILEMKKNGITPYITLFHWDMPKALFDKGGWLNENCVEWFGEYAKVVAENFSDLCEYFITLNEPQCFVGLGHMVGCHAPGLQLDIKDDLQIAHNAMKAHGQAVINLRKYAKQPIKVGYAPTGGVAMPYTNSPEDIQAARDTYFGVQPNLNRWYWTVSMFSDPVFLGHYPESGLEKYKDYLPKITKEDLELIHQPLDFMGQNIYNGFYVRAGKDGKPEYVDRKDGFDITASKWPVSPDCLYWGMKFLYEKYHLPIFITENGCSNADVVSGDGRVHDPERINFLDKYLSCVQKAYDEGIEIAGYFQWSFLDNFEWDKGFTERFGIVYVDYETQERIAKDSAFWYRDMMACNGRNLSINQPIKKVVELLPAVSALDENTSDENTSVENAEVQQTNTLNENKPNASAGISLEQSLTDAFQNYANGTKEDYFAGSNLEEIKEAAKLLEEYDADPDKMEQVKITAEDVDNRLLPLEITKRFQVSKMKITKPITIDSTFDYLLLKVRDGQGMVNGKLVGAGTTLLIPNHMKQIDISGQLQLLAVAAV